MCLQFLRIFVFRVEWGMGRKRQNSPPQSVSDLKAFLSCVWLRIFCFVLFFRVLIFFSLQSQVLVIISFWHPAQRQHDYVCHRFSMLLQAGLKLGLVWPKDNSSANKTDFFDLASRCSASVSHFFASLLPRGLKPACQCDRPRGSCNCLHKVWV